MKSSVPVHNHQCPYAILELEITGCHDFHLFTLHLGHYNIATCYLRNVGPTVCNGSDHVCPAPLSSDEALIYHLHCPLHPTFYGQNSIPRLDILPTRHHELPFHPSIDCSCLLHKDLCVHGIYTHMLPSRPSSYIYLCLSMTCLQHRCQSLSSCLPSVIEAQMLLVARPQLQKLWTFHTPLLAISQKRY